MILHRSVGINASTAATEQNILIWLPWHQTPRSRDGFLRLAVMFLGVGVLVLLDLTVRGVLKPSLEALSIYIHHH